MKEIVDIILAGLGIVVTGLCSWLVKAATDWFDSKVRDKDAAALLSKATLVVTDAVQAVYQQFVEAKKECGEFDADAQALAKQRAFEIIRNNMAPDVKEYIEKNFGACETWIGDKIESVIYGLKNK